ncbi:hypothetical protein Droror1_Dr00023901 [Drosera rotundifolia]
MFWLAALVDAAGKLEIGHNVTSKWELFDEMSKRNAVTWGAMVTGYALMGYFREALELFNEMIMMRGGIRASSDGSRSHCAACFHRLNSIRVDGCNYGCLELLDRLKSVETFSSTPDVETLSSAVAADTDHGGVKVTNNEMRKMLTDAFVDNATLRKQINSLIPCALRTSDAYKFERDEDDPDPH